VQVLAFFTTLFLLPGSHELATPGPVNIPLQGTNYLHLRWKSLRNSGYWEPPTLRLPMAGTYWVSAATKTVVRNLPAQDFNRLLASEGLTVVEDFRKKYRQQDKPGRYVASEYAKTMITVGPPEPIQPVELNLPIEFVLRYPQLLQLNFRGSPIEGIQISLNGKPIGRTNGAGQLPLPPLNSASRLTATVVRVYPDPSTAPWEFFHASLTLPPLSQRQAAIDNRQLAGDEARSRQVKYDRVRHLISRSITSRRSLLAQCEQRCRIGFFKRYRPGRDAVHADHRRPSSGHGARHVNHTRL
jgi:hypothetical protein